MHLLHVFAVPSVLCIGLGIAPRLALVPALQEPPAAEHGTDAASPRELCARARAANGDRDVVARAAAELLAQARPAPADDAVVRSLGEMGRIARSSGLLSESRALLELALQGEPAPDLRIALREDLAFTLQDLGQPHEARRLLEANLAELEASPGTEDAQWRTKHNLAAVLFDLGDFETALGVLRDELAAVAESMDPADPEILSIKSSLVVNLMELGDLDEALQVSTDVVDALERAGSERSPELVESLTRHAGVLARLGRTEESCDILRDAVDRMAGVLREGDPALLVARQNLAISLSQLGRLEEAREIHESVLGIRERELPAGHPDIESSQLNLAGVLSPLGDLERSRTLYELVVAARRQRLEAADPLLLNAELGMAVVSKQLGRLEEARALEEAALEGMSSRFPAGHPDVILARHNLGATLAELGEFAASLEHEEAALHDALETMGPWHPMVRDIRGNLATLYLGLGDAESSRHALEELLEFQRRTLESHDRELLRNTANFVVTLRVMGDREAEVGAIHELLDSIDATIREASLRPRREAMAITASLERVLEIALSFRSEPADAVDPHLFEILEGQRVASAGLLAFRDVALDDRLRGSMSRLESLRAEVRRASDAMRSTDDLTRLEQAIRERDDAEREWNRALAERGWTAPRIAPAAVAAALERGAVAVGYRRYTQWDIGRDMSVPPPQVSRVLAYVIDASARLQRVDLGPAADVADAVRDWRAAILSEATARALPDRGSGLPGATEGAGDDVVRLGDRVRRLVLDPVLSLVDAPRRVHVVPDGELHLLPWSALPGESGYLRDQLEILVEPSLARLFQPRRAERTAVRLLAIGGVDYDRGDAGTEPSDPGAQSPVPAWQPLPGTLPEAVHVGEIFQRALGAEPTLLTADRASKRAFLELAPGATFFHLATHGFSLRSAGERPSTGGLDTSIGTAMTRCGIVLAGANRSSGGADDAGTLTAEELAGIDLSRCELAVLSACETSLGSGNSGQVVQSLQTALHAGGARTAITSLWKVDDEATRLLFEEFYSRAWLAGESPGLALWHAQTKLRARGHPVRDWAGWVLTGSPD